jgi:hypothetical protein
MAAANAAHIHEALIVGGGFGGIGMGITLERAGIDDFLILERGSGPGGVWRDNTYPGAACDVPSHLYSFSFAPNPHWSRTFASRDEIHAYLQRCVLEHGLAGKLRCRAEVAEAVFDEEAGVWRARWPSRAPAGCRSWYLDEQGRNTVNWPGFSLTYRWLATRSKLSAYRFTRPGDCCRAAGGAGLHVDTVL